MGLRVTSTASPSGGYKAPTTPHGRRRPSEAIQNQSWRGLLLQREGAFSLGGVGVRYADGAVPSPGLLLPWLPHRRERGEKEGGGRWGQPHPHHSPLDTCVQGQAGGVFLLSHANNTEAAQRNTPGRNYSAGNHVWPQHPPWPLLEDLLRAEPRAGSEMGPLCLSARTPLR